MRDVTEVKVTDTKLLSLIRLERWVAVKIKCLQ